MVRRFSFKVQNIFKFSFSAASEGFCRTTIKSWNWKQKRNFDTCTLDINEIDDADFTIPFAAESSVEAFGIFNKKGVKFLPTNLLSTFPNLILIQVYNCSVTTVNGNHFKGLSKVESLNLPYNRIESVANDAFVDLVRLEYLGLNYNRIHSIRENAFASLKELISLRLDNNKIQTLHPNVFRSLLKIQEIFLNQNKIVWLDENIFEKAINLQTISLEANKLERISRNLFKNNLKLEKIALNTNNIQFIDASMFDHLQNAKFVNLKESFCIDKLYYKNDFDAMKNDFKQNCNENGIMETTENSVQGWFIFFLKILNLKILFLKQHVKFPASAIQNCTA